MYFTLSESVSGDVVDRGAGGGSVPEPIANDWKRVEFACLSYFLTFLFILIFYLFPIWLLQWCWIYHPDATGGTWPGTSVAAVRINRQDDCCAYNLTYKRWLITIRQLPHLHSHVPLFFFSLSFFTKIFFWLDINELPLYFCVPLFFCLFFIFWLISLFTYCYTKPWLEVSLSSGVHKFK